MFALRFMLNDATLPLKCPRTCEYKAATKTRPRTFEAKLPLKLLRVWILSREKLHLCR